MTSELTRRKSNTETILGQDPEASDLFLAIAARDQELSQQTTKTMGLFGNFLERTQNIIEDKEDTIRALESASMIRERQRAEEKAVWDEQLNAARAENEALKKNNEKLADTIELLMQRMLKIEDDNLSSKKEQESLKNQLEQTNHQLAKTNAQLSAPRGFQRAPGEGPYRDCK